MNYTDIFGFIGGIAGGIYILGGFIVNTYLERYGVVEYQILRVKYLAVGINYLLFLLVASMYTFAFASVILFFVFLQNTDLLTFFSFTGIAALPWSLGFVYLMFAKQPLQIRLKGIQIIKPSVTFIIFTGFLMLFPYTNLFLYLYKIGDPIINNRFMVFFFWFATLLSETIYFGRHIYGQPESYFGRTSLLGSGIPVSVQLAVPAAEVKLLAEVGITTSKNGVTNPLLLLDETDHSYIVGIEQNGNIQAAKIRKDIIKIIHYSQKYS